MEFVEIIHGFRLTVQGFGLRVQDLGFRAYRILLRDHHKLLLMALVEKVPIWVILKVVGPFEVVVFGYIGFLGVESLLAFWGGQLFERHSGAGAYTPDPRP